MEPEETAPSKGKKFLKIALWVLGTLAVLIGTAYFLTAIKNAKQAEEKALNNATEAVREPTEAEKLLKAQNEELDTMRAQYQAKNSSTATATVQNQTQTLDALRNQALKQKPTPVVTPRTAEQQSQSLDALRAALIK